MLNIAQKINELQVIREEQGRLLDIIKFYSWLEDHYLTWDQIAGKAKVIMDSNVRTFIMTWAKKWNRLDEVTEWFRGNRIFKKNIKYAVSFKLKNGKKVLLPYPPFGDEIVFNRTKNELAVMPVRSQYISLKELKEYWL